MTRAINKFHYLFLCFILIDAAWAIGPPYILHVQTTLCSVQVLPSGDDILAQSKAAHERLERFLRESVEPRLAYEYKDYFYDEKEEAKLAGLASRASLDLQGIYDAQECESALRITRAMTGTGFTGRQACGGRFAPMRNKLFSLRLRLTILLRLLQDNRTEFVSYRILSAGVKQIGINGRRQATF
jgi:hypothetical protein